MIKVKKSDEAPKSLSTTKAYDGEDVKEQLFKDQNEKCYLCERILTTDFEIEHLHSQHNFPDEVQDWNNLFLSCNYCNNKKLSNHDDILNPVHRNIEQEIRQEIDFEQKKAKFTSIQSGTDVDSTISFLENVYNGRLSYRKIKEEKFFEDILSVVISFSKLVLDYLTNPSTESESAVRSSLAVTKEALGFKYWIIKSNPTLESVFGSDIIWNR